MSDSVEEERRDREVRPLLLLQVNTKKLNKKPFKFLKILSFMFYRYYELNL